MQCTIDEASPKDIPKLVSIFGEAVCHTANNPYSPEQRAAWASRGTPERFAELFESGLYFLIAKQGQTEVAFASMSKNGYLHSLFVRPLFQRMGIAQFLIARAIDYAKQHNAIQILADVSITALPCFQRAGFEIIRENVVIINSVSLKNYTMQYKPT